MAAPEARRRITAAPLHIAAMLALALAVLAGCAPSASNSPSGAACANDVRAPGTVPSLELLLPRGMIEAAPTKVDSGLSCTDEALGLYRDEGIKELQFAGATWDYGNGDATVVAVLYARPVGQPALEVGWVEEFYTQGALAGRSVDNIDVERPEMRGPGKVFRLEAINNLSLQTVVVWPAGPYVRVVIVATTVEPGASREDHDQRVEIAVEVAAGVPLP
jgi:hypothetical protein